MTSGYREVLALPGVTPLMTLSLLARVPASAAAITLTLHVVLTLDLGYAAAGAVGAAATVGMAVGAPLLGRLVDRRGLRPMLTVTIVAALVFWSVAPDLSYPALLVGAFVGGVLSFPLYSIIRQALASSVPQSRRRPAFALDSMSVEVSYIIGPAVGSVLVVAVSSPIAMGVVGVGAVATGVGFWILNPPTRVGPADPTEPVPAIRTWLDRRLVAVLLGTAATVFLVFGVELSVIASVQGDGPVYAIAVVNAVWCAASLVGGYLYGRARRSYPQVALLAGLAVAVVPVALGGVWWSFAFLLAPAGMLIAPALAAGSEQVSLLAPDPARGVVTGLHGSATMLGATVGTPLAGVLIDVASPAVAILVVAAVGLLLAGVAAALSRP